MQKRNIGGWMLLFLFMGFWCNTTLFPHTHTIDGRILLHSHIFFGTSGHEHQHTVQQFQLIAQLSLLVATAVTFFSFLLKLFGKPFVFWVQKTSARRNRSVRIFSLRAPPVY